MTITTAAAMVAAARQRVETLAVDQVADEIAGNKALLVDIRETEERLVNGAIPTAVHAALGMLEFYADPTSPYRRADFDPDRRIILYCASSGRSALAADMLQHLGYTRVAHLDGGLKAWKEAGNRTEAV